MKNILYLGLEPPDDPFIEHCPLIRIVPRPSYELQNALAFLPYSTHLIFTSKNGIRVLSQVKDLGFCFDKICLSVGKATSDYLQYAGFKKILTADVETAEGVVSLIQQLPAKGKFFWGHAAGARPLIADNLRAWGLEHRECVLYDTETLFPEHIPDLNKFKKIIFTSPSTVKAFIEVFGPIPQDKEIIAKGPVTRQALDDKKCF